MFIGVLGRSGAVKWGHGLAWGRIWAHLGARTCTDLPDLSRSFTIFHGDLSARAGWTGGLL